MHNSIDKNRGAHGDSSFMLDGLPSSRENHMPLGMGSVNEKYYDIYFDPAELEVDENGDLMNWNALYILEYNEDGKVLNRVDYNGKMIDFGDISLDDILDLHHVGHGDDSLEEAMNRFSEWLSDNTEWVESASQTYWQPAEYRCVGISGYTFGPLEFWYPVRYQLK